MGSVKKNRPSSGGVRKSARAPGSALGIALVGALALSDRFTFGEVGVALGQLRLHDLGSHSASGAGQFSLAAGRLSAAAQQVVSSLDYSARSERFLVDAGASYVSPYSPSFASDVSGAGAYFSSVSGSAVPPELRGPILAEGSSPGNRSTSYVTADAPNQGSSYLSAGVTESQQALDTNTASQSGTQARDLVAKNSKDQEQPAEAPAAEESAADLFAGLDVSSEQGYGTTTARVQVEGVSQTELADAQNPNSIFPQFALAGGAGAGAGIGLAGTGVAAEAVAVGVGVGVGVPVAVPVVVAVPVAVVEAGAGGGAGAGAGAGGFSGRVFDGYIANMDVFIDLNGNLQWDAGELKTVTGANGAYSFSQKAPTDALIVARGNAATIDISTGASVNLLVASAGTQYISPLSSAYAFAATDVERANLLKSVGLSNLNYDPIAVVQAGGDTNSAEFKAAATMVKSGAALLSLVSNTASIVSGITGADANTATRSIFSTLAKQSESSLANILVGVDGTDGTKVLGLIKGSLNEASGVADYVASLGGTNATSLDAILTSSAKAIRGLTAAMNKVDMSGSGGLSDVFSTAAVAQNQLKASISGVADLVAAGNYTAAAASATAATAAYTEAAITSLKIEAKQFAALNADDGSAVVAKADVFRLNVGGETQTFAPLANDTNRTGGDLGLVYVGVRDLSATVGVGQLGDDVAGAITLRLGSGVKLYNEGDRLNKADVLKELELYTLDGKSYWITGYKEVGGTGTLTLSGASGDVLSGESIGFALAKKLPQGLMAELNEDGRTLSMSYTAPVGTPDDKSDDLLAVDLFYVAGAKSDPTQLDANYIKVYIQPPAPSISFAASVAEQLQVSGGKLVVSESISQLDVAKTEVSLPLVINPQSLGVNGYLRIEADYADWSDKQWLLGTGDNTVVYSAAKVRSASYEDGFAAVWTVKQVDVVAKDLSTFRLSVPDDWSGELSPFSVSATAVYGAEKNTTIVSTATGVSTFQVIVRPLADGVDVLAGNTFNLAANVVAVNEDVASGFFISENALQTQIANLRLRDTDSEGLAIRLSLPSANSLALFVKNSVATADSLSVVASADGLSVSFYAHGVAAVNTLAKALATQALQGNPNAAGSVAIDYKVGSYEISSLTAAGPSNLSWNGLSGKFSVSIQPVSDVPNVPVISLQSDFSGAAWSQDNYAGVGVFKVPVYYRLSGGDPDEVLSLAVDAFAVDAVSAVIYQDGKVVNRDNELGRYTLAPSVGGQGFFEVEVSDDISSGLNLSLMARSLDASLGDLSANYAQTAAVPLQIPFRATPKAPTVQFLPSALLSFQEDADILLTDILSITPAGGRTLKDLTLKLDIPSSDVGLSVYRDGVDVTGQEIKLSSVADATGRVDLSRLTFRGELNAKGMVEGIKLTAYDTVYDTVSETLARSQLVEGTSGVLRVTPVADGVQASALSASLAQGLVVGLGVPVELSDGRGGGFLSGLVKIDSSETASIRLGFKGVESADVALQVGDRYLGSATATFEGSKSLYFSISEADLRGGEPITLYGRNGFSSVGASVSGGYIQAYTNDGGVLVETPVTASFSVLIDADAVAPLTQANDIVATEKNAESAGGIAVPINIAINADRLGFEKIGLKVTTNDTALKGGIFNVSVTDQDGAVIENIKFDFNSAAGAWILFKDMASQLDFDTVKFKTPANYSGDSTLTVTPFAQTGTDKVEASPLQLAVQIVASAEALSLATQTPLALALTETGPSFAHTSSVKLDLLSLLDKSTLGGAGVDADERLIFGVTVPNTLYVYAYNAVTRTAQTLTSTAVDGKRTYSLDRLLNEVTSPAGSGFDQYYLASSSYFSTTQTEKIEVVVKTSEPSSGNSHAVGTALIDYAVTPVANGASAVTLLKSAAQVSESSASVANGVKLSTVIDLASDASYDPSETLSVFISTDTLSNLTLYTLAAGGSVSGHGGATAVIGGKTGWLVDAASLPALYIRGADYFSSANAQRIEFRSVSKEGGQADLLPDLSAPVSFSLTIKPVADGVNAGSLKVDANKTTKEFTAPLAPNDYTVALNTVVTTGASKADTTEEVFYKIQLPYGQLSLVSLNGTTALPRASVDAAKNIVYEVPEAQLGLFGIRGALYRSSNDPEGSSPFSVGVAAFTKEANGAASPVSEVKTVALTVSAQSGQVFHSVPDSVAGPDSGAGVAFGVRAYTLDPSESMSVSIAFKDKTNTLADGDLRFFIGESRVISGEGGFTVVFDDLNKTATLQVTAEARDALKDLRVSSAKDFRLEDRLNVETRFTVSDGESPTVDTAVSSRLGFYKALPEVALQFASAPVKGIGEAAVGFELTRPGLLPTGIALSDVTILISDVPGGAYFVVKDGNSSSPVGASFDQIPGLWVLSGADLFRNGSWKDADKLDLNIVGLNVEGTILVTAVVVDPLGGTSTTQVSPSKSNINLNVADPLIFSWDGADINSEAVANDLIGLDFDKDGTLEFAQYWLPEQNISDVKYSFLVRPSADVGTAIEMSDLFQTFNELVLDLGLDSPDSISAGQWRDTKLWTDLDADGVIDTYELQVMPEAFKLTLPAQQVRQDTGGGFQTLFEADVSYRDSGAESSGKLFAVGIPYLEPIPAAVVSDVAFREAPAVTVSFVSQAAAAAVIPEDAAGGPAFMVGLRKSVLKDGTPGGTHVVALEVSVRDEGGNPVKDWALSAGALKNDFWILTESSLDSPLRVVGLPENFTGSVEVSAKAYATATVSGMPVSMVSQKYDQTLTIEGLADAPLLLSASGVVAWTPSEGGALYLTKDGTAQGQPVLSVFSTDTREVLSVQFTLSGADVADVVVSGASEIIKGAGIYQVAANNLSGVKLTLADHQKTDFSVTFSGMSRQGETSSQSSNSLTFNASVQPDADNLSAATTKFLLSAESVNEGGEPIQVLLTAKPADASEIVKHKVLVGSSVTNFRKDSVLSLSGYSEIAVSNADADFWSGVLMVDAANFKSREWKLFELEGFVDSKGSFTRSGELFLDAFYDGSLTIAQSAYTVEQQNGDKSAPQTRISTLTVNPVVDQAMTQVYFADVHGNTLQTIALTEGDALGATLRLYARSSDPDEQVKLPDAKDLILPKGMTARFVSEDTGFREYLISAASNESIAVDKPITVSAEVIFSDNGIAAPITQQINIELTKISTTPIFDGIEPGGLTFQVVDGQRNQINGDPVSRQGVHFKLPTIAEESRSDDALSYRLEDIPKWMTLVTPAGSLIASSDTRYSLEFEEQELATLRWKFDRDFLVSKDAPDASAKLTLLAIHTEPSNLQISVSQPLDVLVTRSPNPTVPAVFGKTSFNLTEGQFDKISLSDYEINLGGFNAALAAGDADVKSGVSITLSVNGTDDLSSGLSLKFERANGEISQEISGKSVVLSYDEFKSASLTFDDGKDFNGDFGIALSAAFTLGGTTRESKAVLDVGVRVSNDPEEVSSSITLGEESVDEASYIELVNGVPSAGQIGLAVNGYDPVNDDLSVLLRMNSAVQLYKVNAAGKDELVKALDTTAQLSDYDVTDALIESTGSTALSNYRMFVPNGVSEVKVGLVTQSFDKATGLAKLGKDAESLLSISVNPVLDAPELVLSGLQTHAGQAYVVIQEDQLAAKKIGVLSFSPDPTEYSTLELKLSDGFLEAGGKLRVVPNDSVYTLAPTNETVVDGRSFADAYEITWKASKLGDFIPRVPIQVELIPGLDYFNTQAPSNELAGAVVFVEDALTIQATSRFDSVVDRSLALGAPPVSVKILVREANDAPELYLLEEELAYQLEAEIFERFEAAEVGGQLQAAGRTYDYRDADFGDTHAATLISGSRMNKLLTGDSPDTIDSPVTISRGPEQLDAADLTRDGYVVASGSADTDSTYWRLDDMLGILRTKVVNDSDQVEWELLAIDKQLDYLSSGESVVQQYQLVLADYSAKGDDKFGKLYTNVTVTLAGSNDKPEFIEAFDESGVKVKKDVFEVDSTTSEGRSTSPLSVFFVDPDVSQSASSYTAAWDTDSIEFTAAPNLTGRLFSGAQDLVLSTDLGVAKVGEYAVPEQGVRENVFEITGAVPEANQLIAYKTASEEITLDVRVVLSEKLAHVNGADRPTPTIADLTLTLNDVVLPNFDLLLGTGPDFEGTEATKAYRDALFFGGQNDFSEFGATEAEITQIAPEYEKLVSTFVTPAGEPRLDGQMIEVTENAQGEILSSNIYGTSGRDIILAAGEGGSLLYGGDGVSHDMIIGSKGNDLILLGGGIDYVAGSQVPGFVGDEDIYVVSSLIDYAEMETVGMTDVLAIYFAGKAQAMANAIQAHVSSLGVDKAYMVGIIEDLAISAVDDAWEAIDRVYFDGFSAEPSQADAYLLDSGETLITQVFSTGTAGEQNAKAYSLLLSRSDFTLQEPYEDTIFFS
jgi:hypothetical protein